jgi:hypothetical protein
MFGDEHVSQQEVDIIAFMLDRPEFVAVGPWVHSIVLRKEAYTSELEEGVAYILAACSLDTKGIVMNLADLFSAADFVSRKTCSLQFNFHKLFFTALGHELHHLLVYNCRPKDAVASAKNPDLKVIADEDAQTFAEGLLESMAREYNLEPPPLQESPYLAGAIAELLTDDPDEDQNKQGDQTFRDTQRMLISRGLMAYEPADEKKKLAELKLRTFREVMAVSSKDSNNPEWELPAKPIPTLASRPEAKPEPVEQAEQAEQATYQPQSMTEYASQSMEQPIAASAGASVGYSEPEPVWEGQGDPWEESEPVYDTEPYVDHTDPANCTEYAGFMPGTPAPVNTVQPVMPEPPPEPARRIPANTVIDISKLPEEQRWVFKTYFDIYQLCYQKCLPYDMRAAETGIDYRVFEKLDVAFKEPIPLTPQQVAQIPAYDFNFDDTVRSTAETRSIVGYPSCKGMLPAFRLHVVQKDGATKIRYITPQNPNARDKATGLLTKNALEARSGKKILLILDDNGRGKGNKPIFKMVGDGSSIQVLKC